MNLNPFPKGGNRCRLSERQEIRYHYPMKME